METKEDFTLLNLSKSSEESEELFKPESRLPKRKRKTKRRSATQNHSSSGTSTPTNSIAQGLQGPSQINILYTVLIFLFCWIGTLTWLVFSLRNQLTDVTTRLEEATKMVKPFPDQVETMNQTLQKLNSTLNDSFSKWNATQLQLNAVEKNVNSKPLPASDLQDVRKDVADLGSKFQSKLADLENEIKSLKAQGGGGNGDGNLAKKEQQIGKVEAER
jgi:uncharacterized protein YukE